MWMDSHTHSGALINSIDPYRLVSRCSASDHITWDAGWGRKRKLTRTIVCPWTLAESAKKAASTADRSKIIAMDESGEWYYNSRWKNRYIYVGQHLLLIPYR